MQNTLIRGLLIRRKTKQLSFDDEDAIKAAELPDLQPITDEQLWAVKLANRKNLITVLQCLGIFAAFALVCALLKAYMLAFSVGCAVPVLLAAAFILHLRGHIDETAVAMQIPVHSSENGLLGNKAVCYLPDGKYLLTYDRNLPEPRSVTVIQFGKFTYCQFSEKAHGQQTETPPAETFSTIIEKDEES